MLTILHGADFHLDSPFRSLPAAEAACRRQEQRRLLEELRDLALERRADLVLLSGDLFDGREVYPETVSLLAKTLGEMAVPVIIAPGNHDPWSDKSPYAAQPWPDNVHIFRDARVTALPFPALGVTVYGSAFLSESRTDDPLADFVPPADGSVPIMVLHGDVDGRGSYCPVARASIARSGLAYLALGHIHQTSGLQREGDVFWAYPGCPQGRGFDEAGEKGVLVLRLEQKAVSAQFVPLPGPRYRTLTCDVTGLDPEEALRRTLGQGCGDDYIRLTFTGESEGLALAPLRGVGEPLCRALELRDDTRVSRDLWARSAEDTLTGLFLREMQTRLAAAPDEDARRLVERATRYGLAALEGREAP